MKHTWSLLYRVLYCCGGGYCHRNWPRYANGWSVGDKACGCIANVFNCGIIDCCVDPFVWVCKTTSVGWTLLLCSSRFRNLLRTSRIAIIVPLLPTILILRLRGDTKKSFKISKNTQNLQLHTNFQEKRWDTFCSSEELFSIKRYFVLIWQKQFRTVRVSLSHTGLTIETLLLSKYCTTINFRYVFFWLVF